jgi:hypothetical protein
MGPCDRVRHQGAKPNNITSPITHHCLHHQYNYDNNNKKATTKKGNCGDHDAADAATTTSLVWSMAWTSEWSPWCEYAISQHAGDSNQR